MNQKKLSCFFIILAVCCLKLQAQPQIGVDSSSAANMQAVPVKGLFETDEVLALTFYGDIPALLKDRSDDEQYHSITLVYSDSGKGEISIPVQLKTRGNFRKLKENCVYPPIAIKFPESAVNHSAVFSGQKKLKLVMPCRGDQYIINEWLVYKLYNLITPKSFKTRLLTVTFLDKDRKQLKKPFYAFLLEDEKQMALRNGLISVDRKLRPQQVDEGSFLILSVFQYLIANTDWSTQYLQNIKMIATDINAVPFAVPYDFDHAGIVEAPYAKPFEALRMRSIRERRYRGHCLSDLEKFVPVIELFNRQKQEIYDLYNNCSLLDERYKKRTLKFLDEFYKTINTPRDWQAEFTYPCDKNGTGNVVIKGLQH